MRIKQWIGVLAALAISPMAASATDTLDGKALYEANCAMCHGVTGEVSDFGKSLKPFPARNHRAIAKLISRDEMRRIITYGVEGTAMTPKKYTLDALEIEAVIDYIKTFDYKPNLANGKKRFEEAERYAGIVFKGNDIQVIEDIIKKIDEYGAGMVDEAFKVVSIKSIDNPKRSYKYVVGVLQTKAREADK